MHNHAIGQIGISQQTEQISWMILICKCYSMKLCSYFSCQNLVTKDWNHHDGLRCHHSSLLLELYQWYQMQLQLLRREVLARIRYNNRHKTENIKLPMETTKKMLRRRHACDVTYARDRYIQVDNFGIDERISLSSSHCHISNKNQPYRKDIAYGRIPLFSLLFQNN